MAPRPTWQGHLRLSLVTCPVALYTATSPAGDVRFNTLHKDTHNRIRMAPTDPGCHRAAVLALGDCALEVAVVEGIGLHLHRQTLVGRIAGRTPDHGP